MDALTALTQRVSISRLREPAPVAAECEAIFSAALRAADHGNLRPWRFLTVAGDDRMALAQLYVDASLSDDAKLPQAQQDKIMAMPMRAPLVVIAIAQLAEHPKVPKSEMLISAGACVQNMLNAAFALGVGAYWRTGALAYHPQVKAGLGLAEHEEIVGYLYLGTPDMPSRLVPELKVADYFQPWPVK